MLLVHRLVEQLKVATVAVIAVGDGRERANRREVSDSVLAVVKRWLGAYARIYQLPYHAGQIRVQLTNFIGVQS